MDNIYVLAHICRFNKGKFGVGHVTYHISIDDQKTLCGIRIKTLHGMRLILRDWWHEKLKLLRNFNDVEVHSTEQEKYCSTCAKIYQKIK